MEDVQHQIYPNSSFTTQDFVKKNIFLQQKIFLKVWRILLHQMFTLHPIVRHGIKMAVRLFSCSGLPVPLLLML